MKCTVKGCHNYHALGDSFQFMSSSLDKLVENIIKRGNCNTCKPDKCIQRSIKDKGHINHHRTSFPCGKCINCKKCGKDCINPNFDSLKYTKCEIPDTNKFELLSKKEVYPYEYMDSFDKFDETKLHSNNFYSNNTLRMCGILLN